MPLMHGKSKSTVAGLSSLPEFNRRTTAWKFRSAIISAWLFVLSFALRLIALVLVFLDLRPKQALFLLPLLVSAIHNLVLNCLSLKFMKILSQEWAVCPMNSKCREFSQRKQDWYEFKRLPC